VDDALDDRSPHHLRTSLSWEVPVSVVELRPAIANDVQDPAPDPELESIVRSLEAGGLAPRAVIERVVTEELTRFRAARIRTYVPILVERAAADRLVALSVSEA
jgi:hypothetical protein